MKPLILNIELELQGPLLTQSSTPGAPRLDAVMARTSGDAAHSRPVLPGSLVTGRLRQSFEELVDASANLQESPFHKLDIAELLGPDPRLGEELDRTNKPRRARLRFGDFVAEQDGQRNKVRHRIKIDNVTGAADDHMLLTQESPFPPGASVKFAGQATLSTASDEEAARLKRLVELGLRWTTSLGAERTAGFGQLLDVRVEEVETQPATTNTAVEPTRIEIMPEAPWLDLVIRPQSPFCFAQHRREKNWFVSREEIPGAALKACVAEALKRAGELPPRPHGRFFQLASHLDRVVFTHGFPVVKGERRRPVCVPESVVKTSHGWHDLALVPQPCLIQNEAPEFQVDWKKHNDVATEFGWPGSLPRELRVRTAIDRRYARSANEQLFAQERIVPEGHEWLARVELESVPPDDRSDVAKQLRSLLEHGLHGLGKTKACAKVDLFAGGTVSAAYAAATPLVPPPQDMQWVITLQTPAVLGWPEEFGTQPANDPRHGALYRTAWSQLSRTHDAPEGVLVLQHFYARQSLAGGAYLWHRFQKSRAYNPWLLTDAGSVFVLQAATDQVETAQKLIARLQRTGLPLPGWAIHAYGLANDPGQDWRSCPFLPENGYGEIAVNLQCHTDKKPTDISLLQP